MCCFRYLKYKSTMDTATGCIHLQRYKTNNGVEAYRTVHAWFVTPVNEVARERKASSCICHTCHRSGPRLHSCLSCINFSCWGQHMREHMKSGNYRNIPFKFLLFSLTSNSVRAMRAFKPSLDFSQFLLAN